MDNINGLNVQKHSEKDNRRVMSKDPIDELSLWQPGYRGIFFNSNEILC